MVLGVGAGPSRTARARMAGRITVGYLFASHEGIDISWRCKGKRSADKKW